MAFKNADFRILSSKDEVRVEVVNHGTDEVAVTVKMTPLRARSLAMDIIQAARDAERAAQKKPLVPREAVVPGEINEETGCEIHPKEACAGNPCCFHNPSQHHMVSWQKHIRLHRGAMVERICPHGIGHPDPDSLAWMKSIGSNDDGTHGCDGCCQPPKDVVPIQVR